MLTIYITRHWQNIDNKNGILNWHRDLPLTDLGVEQAKQLAKHIKTTDIHFDNVYASPLQRAYQTALTITQELAIKEPTKLDILIERDFWILTGEPITDVEKLATRVLKTDTITYFLEAEGVETFPDLLARWHKIVEYIRQHHTDWNILLVTHGDIGKMIYAAYYNLTREEWLHHFHFWNADLVTLSKDRSPTNAHIFTTEQHNI